VSLDASLSLDTRTHVVFHCVMRGIAAADLFPTDRPIKPEEMVGRNEDVRDIADSLGNGE
jgi:hypothetical protein